MRLLHLCSMWIRVERHSLSRSPEIESATRGLGRVPLRGVGVPLLHHAAGHDHGACQTRRSRVLRLAASPSLLPRRVPAVPPSARPTAVSRPARRIVLRVQGVVTSGRRSAKMRRSHRALSQNRRRTFTSTATACLPLFALKRENYAKQSYDSGQTLRVRAHQNVGPA